MAHDPCWRSGAGRGNSRRNALLPAGGQRPSNAASACPRPVALRQGVACSLLPTGWPSSRKKSPDVPR
eukprot:15139205-Alexandrium_andersonii.AAC.1